jgi:Signal transduction histidine kinase regulating C4-dicarboxylate transport system
MLTKGSIPWWMRIKVQFLVFGVAMSILPLFFLGYLGFTSVRQNLEKNIYEHNFDQVIVFAHEIQDFFTRIEDSLTLTTATSAGALIGEDSVSRQSILKTLLQKEPFIEEIKVIDINSKVIGQIVRHKNTFPNSSMAKIESTLALNKSPSLSEVFFSNDGRPEIFVIVPIQEPATGVQIGQLKARLDLTEVIKRFINKQLDKEEYIFLVDQSGNLIGHTNSSGVLQNEEIRENPAVQDFLEGKDLSAESEHKNQDGVNVVGAYASVGTPNWAVFVEQPASEANKPIHEFALRLIMIAILIMVLVMILSIAFGLKVVQPIENLEGQVRRIISTGDLESHIPIESWDEIGRLVQSFNQLLNSLDIKNENIKDEKKLLTTVVDGIGAGMVLLNPDKKIIWWNTKFAEWFGNQLENLSSDQVVKGEGMEGFCLENGRNISVYLNDERRHFRQMFYKLSPDNLENAAYLVLLEDVTQEVEMEARMIETDKMAAVGLLASGVAHEINNPLAIVAAHSEELLDRLNEEEPGPTQGEIKNAFKTVLEQIARCKQITDSLLGFARKRINERELINISAATVQTLGLLEHKTKQKYIKLKILLEDSLFVLSNENEWQQVVLNLITNALDASAKGGVIEVKGWREDDDTIHFSVKDFGEGIPKIHLKKAFDPFFTTKPVGQGTGLGLYVSYGIIQKMQGKMILESTEGQGTLVKITLPLHRQEIKADEVLSKDSYPR